MIHEIEITTVEALIVIEALRGFKFGNSVDKDIAERLVDNIVKVTADDLKKGEEK